MRLSPSTMHKQSDDQSPYVYIIYSLFKHLKKLEVYAI
jgi:hypothetical protein